MSYATETLLKDLVLTHPGAFHVLEAHHLDYCCGGRQSLAEACREAGLDPELILLELRAAKPEPAVRVSADTLTALMDHIVATHHAFTRDSLRRSGELLDRVVKRHGAVHPELAELEACFRRLADDLLPHLKKEEEILFPYVEALEAHAHHGTPLPGTCFGSVASPIGVMTQEHQTVGDLLKQARRLTRDYAPPADACASYALLYSELEALEKDLMRHIHLENNVLFPRALGLSDSP